MYKWLINCVIYSTYSVLLGGASVLDPQRGFTEVPLSSRAEILTLGIVSADVADWELWENRTFNLMECTTRLLVCPVTLCTFSGLFVFSFSLDVGFHATNSPLWYYYYIKYSFSQ